MAKMGSDCNRMASLHSPPLHISTSTEPPQDKVVQPASLHTSCYEAPVCRVLLTPYFCCWYLYEVPVQFRICFVAVEVSSKKIVVVSLQIQTKNVPVCKHQHTFLILLRFEWLLHIPTFSLVRSTGAQQCQRKFAVIVIQVQLSQKPDWSRKRSGVSY